MTRTFGSSARRCAALMTGAILVAATVGIISAPSRVAATDVLSSPDPGQSIAPVPTPSVDPGPSPSPSPSPLPPGVVGAAGGAIVDGAVALAFPPGAVGTPIRVWVTQVGEVPAFDGQPVLAAFGVRAADLETGATVDAFAAAVALSYSAVGLDLAGIDPADLVLVRLAPDGSWEALSSWFAGGAVRAMTFRTGTYAVVEQIPARPVLVDHSQVSDAPAEGRHRIEPGSLLQITIRARPAAKIAGVQLAEAIPAGWTVVDGDGGSWDPTLGLVTWPLRTVAARTTVARRIVVRAPTVSPADGRPAFAGAFGSRFTYRGGASEAPELSVLVAPRLVIQHRTLAQVDDLTLAATYLPEDAWILGEQRFEVFRIRFQVRNADDQPIRWTPQLEFRSADGGPFTAVPAGGRRDGVGFWVTPERVRSAGPYGGTAFGPDGTEISEGEIRSRERDEPDELPALGYRSMGRNPAPAITLPPRSYAEVEFSVRATVDASYLTTYEFRVTDAGIPFTGAASAIVAMGSPPPLDLTPGQRSGIPVADGSGVAVDGRVLYPLVPPASPKGSEASAVPNDHPGWGSGPLATPRPRYALLAAPLPQGMGGPTALAAAFTSPHGGYTSVAASCAVCHRTHTAANGNLLGAAAPESSLCFSCHNGTGATTNVLSQYADPTVPVNDAAGANYYRHDALVVTNHTQAGVEEFKGVLNRHSECGDCHDAHRATSTPSSPTASGWTLSGQLSGVSGVAVTNGPKDTAPAVTFAAPATLEYQLCLKCHSAYTTLPAQVPGKPSTWALDTGREFNPANDSFHPIEAAGTNATTQMANSLSGTSPYKLWTFSTSGTVRCLNCHGDYRKATPASPPAAGADLAPHADEARGLLMSPYRDRALKSSSEPYSASDFALCYQCHAEAPFKDTSGNTRSDSNFRYHGLHVSKLAGKGNGGTDIDTAGAGQGNAVCSECHFRIHSTTFRYGAQDAYQRLVNFAPDVTGLSAGSFSLANRSCSLTCHGQGHGPERY